MEKKYDLIIFIKLMEEYVYTFIYNTVNAYKEFVDAFQDELKIKKYDGELENNIIKGYLIDKEYFNYWKKFTDYEQIKDLISGDYQSARKIIKRYRKNNPLKQYQPDTYQWACYNPFKFYKALKMEGKQYVLVNYDVWKLICYEDAINQIGQTNYFLDKNKIIFSFASRGKVEMETNDNVIIGTKKMFLKNVNNFEKEVFDDDDEEDHIREIKKLILLYAFEQEVKNKINNLRYQDNSFTKYYLISKDWIDEFKKYYHYNELSNLINQKPDLRNLLNNGYENAKKYLEYAIAKISLMRKKSKKTFPDNLRDENTFLSEGNRVRINNSEITYWKNFELINEHLKTLLSNSAINEYDIEGASSAECLISGGKLILDLSNDQNNEGNYAFEIGFIRNNDMIFVDEYIFQYENEIDKNNHLEFFKDKFYLFQKDELNFGMNLRCDLMDDEGNVYGTAFKIPPHE